MKKASLSVLCRALLVLAAALPIATATAATQGSWGATSTASAKITLRILPRTETPAPATAGHEALSSFCASHGRFQNASQRFTASAAAYPAESTDVDRLLRASCESRIADTTALPSGQHLEGDQFTLLIAPI